MVMTLLFFFPHVRDEPWGFSEYFLVYHRQGDSSDQFSLTVYVFVSLSDSKCGVQLTYMHFVANINTHNLFSIINHKTGNLRRKQNCQIAAYQSQRAAAKTLAMAPSISRAWFYYFAHII